MISNVIPHSDDDELARRFDVLILQYQLALLVGSETTDMFVDKIYGISKELLKKQNIPAVTIHVELLKELQTDTFWQGVNINRLEEVRTALRGLIKFIDKESQVDVITHFADKIDPDGIGIQEVVPIYKTLQSYKVRIPMNSATHSDLIRPPVPI